MFMCRYYNNAFYAKVGGISTAEMNLLEVDFLFGLGFELNVTPNIYNNYCSHLQTEMLLQSSASLPFHHLPDPTVNESSSHQQHQHQHQLAAV